MRDPVDFIGEHEERALAVFARLNTPGKIAAGFVVLALVGFAIGAAAAAGVVVLVLVARLL